ncbi:unnamed protein product [Bubo scandiacus]
MAEAGRPGAPGGGEEATADEFRDIIRSRSALSLKSFGYTESQLFVKKEDSRPHYTSVELKNKDQAVSVTLPSVHR